MNRGIKYRGRTIPFTEKEKDGSIYVYKGEWVYGFFHTALGGDCHIIEDSKTSRMYPGSKVIPESVGEFTGLKDLYKNDIFEKDIVLAYDRPHEVVFSDGAFYLKNKNSHIRLSRVLDDLKVIGNIYETPELLTNLAI